MPTDEPSSDESPASPRFTLRTALALQAVIGIIVSIPLVGLGFSLTASILLGLCALQLPLFVLFGAFGMADRPSPEHHDHQEWDRWREDRAMRG
jgi:hypothetical protein